MAGLRLAHLPAFLEVCQLIVNNAYSMNIIHVLLGTFLSNGITHIQWIGMITFFTLWILNLFFKALHCLIPGIIHSLKQDGGAKSIANFTNYTACQSEILWAFRIIGEFFCWIAFQFLNNFDFLRCLGLCYGSFWPRTHLSICKRKSWWLLF